MSDLTSATKANIGRGGQEPSESQRVDKIQYAEDDEPKAQGQNAFNSERPLNVLPTQSGGVARDGRDDLPMGKAGMVDKAIGKTEKVIGKATHNTDMHEAGELRESGGKDAVTGQARAPHD
ncbi:hypothetical protein EI94DRAFT_1799016 [Lactarius quietus]|nr:hypothetical protein EI94DRAFT_1799016 [Lactarius quietus]